MSGSVRSPLEAVVAVVVPQWPPLSAEQREAVTLRCAAYFRRQLSLAPAHVRIGFTVMFAVFVMYGCLRYRRGSSRWQDALRGFSRLPLPMANAVERSLRTSTMLAFFDDPDVLAAIGVESPAARQDRFRALRARVVAQP